MIFLFDVNGTLFDDIGLTRRVISQLLESRGFTPTDEDLHGVMHYATYLQDNFGIDQDDFYSENVRRLATASSRDTIAEGAEDCLREIDRRGHKRAAVTSFRRRGFDAYNSHFDEDVRFETSVVQEDTPGHKPDAEPLEHALNLLREPNADLDRVWMVGDSDADIHAARNLGCHGALYRPSGKQKDQLEQDSTVVFTHFDELLALIDQHYGEDGPQL